jgi:hypothetical protein
MIGLLWPGFLPTPTGPFIFKPVPLPFNPGGTVYQTTSSRHDSSVTPTGGYVPVLYGRCKIPGKFINCKVINTYLHMIYLFGVGEFESYETIYVNDKVYTEYGSAVHVEKYYGTQTQTVCSLNSYDATWTNALTGEAYLYMRFIQTNDIQDLPTVEAICKGKKIYDPRTGTIYYSANPALVMADVMTETNYYGARIASSLIDWDSVSLAANRCDEIVGTDKRFEFNYCFDEQRPLNDVFDIIRIHFLGSKPIVM